MKKLDKLPFRLDRADRPSLTTANEAIPLEQNLEKFDSIDYHVLRRYIEERRKIAVKMGTSCDNPTLETASNEKHQEEEPPFIQLWRAYIEEIERYEKQIKEYEELSQGAESYINQLTTKRDELNKNINKLRDTKIQLGRQCVFLMKKIENIAAGLRVELEDTEIEPAEMSEELNHWLDTFKADNARIQAAIPLILGEIKSLLEEQDLIQKETDQWESIKAEANSQIDIVNCEKEQLLRNKLTILPFTPDEQEWINKNLERKGYGLMPPQKEIRNREARNINDLFWHKLPIRTVEDLKSYFLPRIGDAPQNSLLSKYPIEKIRYIIVSMLALMKRQIWSEESGDMEDVYICPMSDFIEIARRLGVINFEGSEDEIFTEIIKGDFFQSQQKNPELDFGESSKWKIRLIWKPKEIEQKLKPLGYHYNLIRMGMLLELNPAISHTARQISKDNLSGEQRSKIGALLKELTASYQKKVEPERIPPPKFAEEEVKKIRENLQKSKDDLARIRLELEERNRQSVDERFSFDTSAEGLEAQRNQKVRLSKPGIKKNPSAQKTTDRLINTVGVESTMAEVHKNLQQVYNEFNQRENFAFPQIDDEEES